MTLLCDIGGRGFQAIRDISVIGDAHSVCEIREYRGNIGQTSDKRTAVLFGVETLTESVGEQYPRRGQLAVPANPAVDMD